MLQWGSRFMGQSSNGQRCYSYKVVKKVRFLSALCVYFNLLLVKTKSIMVWRLSKKNLTSVSFYALIAIESCAGKKNNLGRSIDRTFYNDMDMEYAILK